MKTAVEWLIEQLLEQGYFDGNKPLTFTNLDHLQQQAKAMEQEQIISVYWDAYNEGKYSTDKTAEQYYKETFIT